METLDPTPEEQPPSRSRVVSPFDLIAPYYDGIMDSVDYEIWAEHIIAMLDLYATEMPRSVVDLACGTGSLLIELYDIHTFHELVGMDSSPGMLREARNKWQIETSMQHFEPPAGFICGDLRHIPLRGEFPFILCTFDSINFILDYETLVSSLRSVAALLEPQGLFIFDITTEYNVLSNFNRQRITEAVADFRYGWECSYDRKQRLSAMRLWVEDTSNPHSPISLTLFEHIYSNREILRAIEQAGLELKTAVETFGTDKPNRHSERITYVVSRRM